SAIVFLGDVNQKAEREQKRPATWKHNCCHCSWFISANCILSGSLGTRVICQTQPIKMTWSPLRLFFQAIGDLRGGFKRENEMDVNLFSRHDHIMNQALSNGLALLKRKPFEIVT